jgi:hypothetical protein
LLHLFWNSINAKKASKTDWLLQQLNKLGYTVQLEPLAAPA